MKTKSYMPLVAVVVVVVAQVFVVAFGAGLSEPVLLPLVSHSWAAPGWVVKLSARPFVPRLWAVSAKLL
jgi:hypothetical protein